MENKNKKITKQLFALALVLVVLLCGSYAWLTLTLKGNNTNVLRAGTLSLVLDDTTSNGIKLEKAVPISDEKGKTGTEYTFTLQNKGTKAASYTIYLDDVALEASETRMDDSKVKYQLTKNSKETVALLNTLSDKVLDSGTIDGSTTNTYSLRVWIDSAAGNEVMGTILSKQLRVEATQVGAKNNPTTTAMCKRATTLHKEVCTNTDNRFCLADGYSLNSEIEYGSLGTKGTLTSGDAFDCDVNGDGEYDSDTERFYYVSDATNGITTDSDTAVLIYYSNVSGGVASNSTAYAYDESGSNSNGPVTAVKQLPTTSQWKTTLSNKKRDIADEKGIVQKTGFSYEGYAARLLTYQEVYNGCYDGTTGISSTKGISTKCKYLIENTKYSNESNKTYGGRLESPSASYSSNSWFINSNDRNITTNIVNDRSNYGVRPAIEVAKTNIDY